jgi:hypothetical protein
MEDHHVYSSHPFDREINLKSPSPPGWPVFPCSRCGGVSLLALVQPAGGEIVVTRKTIPIPITPLLTPEPVKISMANNGIDDFIFDLFNDTAISSRFLLLGGASQRDEVVAGGAFYAKALALPRGARIGPSSKAIFSDSNLVEASETGNAGRYSRGYWGGSPKDRYLGVRFTIDGETHYGWIRLAITTNLQMGGPFMSAKITGYAYETEPNTAIFVGIEKEPPAEESSESIQNQGGPSLGMLALGADGMPLWRRDEASTPK